MYFVPAQSSGVPASVACNQLDGIEVHRHPDLLRDGMAVLHGGLPTPFRNRLDGGVGEGGVGHGLDRKVIGPAVHADGAYDADEALLAVFGFLGRVFRPRTLEDSGRGVERIRFPVHDRDHRLERCAGAVLVAASNHWEEKQEAGGFAQARLARDDGDEVPMGFHFVCRITIDMPARAAQPGG